MQRRNTNQRQEVVEALEILGHSTSEELIEYLNKNDAKVSLATIYRNLNTFIEDGKVRKVKIGDLDVYETVKKRHFHFRCKKCGAIIDIDPQSVVVDQSSIKQFNGSIVQDYDMIFYGICSKCELEINKY